MALLLPLVTALLPILILPGLFFHFDVTPKIIIILLAAALVTAQGKSAGRWLASLRQLRRGRLLVFLALAQILWLALTSALSSRPWFSALGSTWRRMGLVEIGAIVIFTVLVTGCLSVRPEIQKGMLRAFAISAIVISLYGICQFFGVDPLQPPAAYRAYAGDSMIVRPPGTLGHADYLGWWLCIAFFCSIASAQQETGSRKWTAYAGAVLSVLAVLASGTRSALLGVLGGALVFLFAAKIRPGWKSLVWIAAGVAGMAGIYVSPAGALLRARVKWSLEEPLGGARLSLWRDSVRMVAAHPVTGTGLETFPAEFPRYQSVELAQAFPDFYHESPHNTALDLATSAGLPGLLLGAGWIALGFRRGASPALSAALVASCTASVFGVLTAGPAVATAMVIAMLVASEPRGNRAAAEKPSRAAGIALTTVSAVAASAFVAFAACLAVRDFRLEQFRAGPTANSYRSVLSAALPGTGDDLYCSRALQTTCGPVMDCAITALQAAAAGTRTADNPANAWYNLAVFQAEQNDATGAERSFRSAIAAAPNWYKPHWALSKVLGFRGGADEAQKELRLAVFLDGGHNPEVKL